MRSRGFMTLPLVMVLCHILVAGELPRKSCGIYSEKSWFYGTSPVGSPTRPPVGSPGKSKVASSRRRTCSPPVGLASAGLWLRSGWLMALAFGLLFLRTSASFRLDSRSGLASA